MENAKLIEIPDFTAEQYYNSSEPYAFLYNFREDKFLLKLLTQQMKARAGAVGV